MVFKHFNYRPSGRRNYNYLLQTMFNWFIIRKQTIKLPPNMRGLILLLLFLVWFHWKKKIVFYTYKYVFSLFETHHTPYWWAPWGSLSTSPYVCLCVYLYLCVCVCMCVCVCVSVLVIHKSNNPNKLSLLHIFATFTIPQQQERSASASCSTSTSTCRQTQNGVAV